MCHTDGIHYFEYAVLMLALRKIHTHAQTRVRVYVCVRVCVRKSLYRCVCFLQPKLRCKVNGDYLPSPVS